MGEHKDLDDVRPIGGPSYACRVCERTFVGGRYVIRGTGTGELFMFCPDCWPLFKAESSSREP
ncbi:hypothetical protein LCGC14_1713960, partial [marine sediment metagenome]